MNTSKQKPGPDILRSLLLAIHLSALPLYTGMPVAIILLIAILSLWQLLIIQRGRSNPGKIIQTAIILAAFLMVLYSYGHIFGQQPGIALVVVMTTLKLFETKDSRDCYIIIYSTFFIIASNFFHSQSIWLIIYVFFVVVVLVSILIALSDRLKSLSLPGRLKLASRFAVYAIPLMLVLFFLFPRIPGPLWGLPDDAYSSRTGLSEEMSPGSINRLISSSAIAFRVVFEGDIPRHSKLYWRGAVLSLYDGRTWRRSDAPAGALANIRYNKKQENRYLYTVTLEPTNLDWLLALEYPIADDTPGTRGNSKLNREAMLLTADKINNVISYSLQSYSDSNNQALFEQESYKNRLLPVQLNPRTVELAGQLLQGVGFDKKRYINNVLSYFRDNDFVYTLNPDLLGDDAMDDFLFNSRRGFCEHYASAFTYLMRAAGIPSRIVIGYQGGKMNPLDDYMIVRQSDAHAWSEVWIDGSWQRVDPTAAVSPERIEQGILNAGLETGSLPTLLMSENSFIKNAAFLYDSFQNRWNQWVIGFDQKKQNELLRALGLENATPSNLILLLVICLTVTGLIVGWFLLTHHSVEKDRVQHYYNMLCRKLQRHGIQRQLDEGPVDFEQRINREQSLTAPTKEDLRFVFKAYRTLHYGNRQDSKLTEVFIKKVRHLKIRKR